MKAELKEIQAQLTLMIADGVNPTDAAFIELANKAGAMKDAIDKANATIGRFASDSRALDQVIDLGQSMTAVFRYCTGCYGNVW